jgi:hypothetical protein
MEGTRVGLKITEYGCKKFRWLNISKGTSARFDDKQYIFLFILPQYMNITTKFSTLKLLFFSFSSCLTIERSIVFKTMDWQCESFSRIFSSATGLDKSFIFIFGTLGLHRLLTKTEIF